jgi:hypothetical protein
MLVSLARHPGWAKFRGYPLRRQRKRVMHFLVWPMFWHEHDEFLREVKKFSPV